MILGFKSAQIPLVLAALVAVAGCGKVDASQAEVCNRVAGVVLSEGAIERIENDVDRAVPHGIVSRVIVRKSTGESEPHEVHCEFAGGAFSDERLHLIAVTTDTEGRLTDLRMAILEIVLAYLYSDRPAEAWRTLDAMWPAGDRERIRKLTSPKSEKPIGTQSEWVLVFIKKMSIF